MTRSRRSVWRFRPTPAQRAVLDSAVNLGLMEAFTGFPAELRLGAVRRAAAVKEASAFPALAMLLLAADPHVRTLAEPAAKRAFDALESREFTAVDRALRKDWAEPLREHVGVGTLPIVLERSGHPALLLGVASCHPDGHVRQAALDVVRREGVELPMPFLLLRLDDCIEAVRKAARARVVERIAPRHVDSLVNTLPLMEALAHRQHVRREKALDWTERLLRNDHAALWRGTRHPDPGVRRSALARLAEASDVDIERLLTLTTRTDDAALASAAARAVLARPGSSLDVLRKSPVARVRALALDASRQEPRERSLSALQAALLDSDRHVRKVATARLRSHGAEPSAAPYRDAIAGSSPNTLRTAADALGRVGDASDLERLLPLLDGSSRLAATALESIARLAPTTSGALLVARLDDPRPRVSRTAARALIGGATFDEQDAWTLTETAANAHGARNAFRVCTRGPRWRRLERLLMGTRSPDPWIGRQAVAGLHRWRRGLAGHAGSSIRSDRAERIETLLEHRTRAVPEAVARDVRSLLAVVRITEAE